MSHSKKNCFDAYLASHVGDAGKISEDFVVLHLAAVLAAAAVAGRAVEVGGAALHLEPRDKR